VTAREPLQSSFLRRRTAFSKIAVWNVGVLSAAGATRAVTKRGLVRESKHGTLEITLTQTPRRTGRVSEVAT
jgi:hypothetical protein